MATELTAERLRELLHYDPETGVFTRRLSSGRWKAGSVAGTYRDRHGYPSHNIGKRLFRAHRLAWLYVHGRWPIGDIDHINGDRGDNRLVNLREVSRSVNLQNKREAQSNSETGFLGVSPTNKPNSRGQRTFHMRIRVGGKTVSKYGFATPEEAHAAYVAAKRSLHEGCTI